MHFDCRGGTSKGALAKKVEKQNSKQHFTSSDLGVNTFENCSSLKQGAMVNRDQSKFSYDIHILMDNRRKLNKTRQKISIYDRENSQKKEI